MGVVYMIFCTSNCKFYIGSTKNVKIRIERHKNKLNSNKHPNFYLQNCWNKYGKDAFFYVILEEVEEICLLKEEQKWMDLTKCYDPKIGFNEVKFAGRTTGYKHSKEYIEKKSKKWILKYKDEQEFEVLNIKDYCRKNNLGNGCKFYKVALCKADQHKGWHCRPAEMTMQDWKEKRRFIRKSYEDKNAKEWICENKNSGVIEKFVNLERFCRINGLSVDVMRNLAKGKGNQHKGWTCKRNPS